MDADGKWWRLASDDEHESAAAGGSAYFEASLMSLVCRRFPWLVSLMLVQSISGFVVERFEALVERHVILAAFLTMRMLTLALSRLRSCVALAPAPVPLTLPSETRVPMLQS